MSTFTFRVEIVLRVSVEANSEAEAWDKCDSMSVDKMLMDSEQMDIDADLIKEN